MAEVLIDLPNLYNALARASVGGAQIPRDYLLHWLDVDLLAGSLGLTEPQNVWVFYADKTLGHDVHRVESRERGAYIKRLDRLPGVTTRQVNVPGEESETFTFQCTQCGTPNEVTTSSEKGVDSGLISHLFDTMEHWKEAAIVSGDADFCPAIASARRRGKLVYGAGVPSLASPALVRECYQYFDIIERFVKEDFFAFRLLHNGGIAPRCRDIASNSADSGFTIRIPPVEVDSVTRNEFIYMTLGVTAVVDSPRLGELCGVVQEIATNENSFIANEEAKTREGNGPFHISRSWWRQFRGKAATSAQRIRSRVAYEVETREEFRPHLRIHWGPLELQAPWR